MRRWWDWASLALLFILLEVVASRLVATTWTPYLYLAQTSTYLAFVIGTGLGYSHFSRRVSQWLSAVFMIIMLPLQWTLAIDQNVSLEGQLVSVGGRLFYSTADFLARRPVLDPLLFVVIMTIAFWIISLPGGLYTRPQPELSGSRDEAIQILERHLAREGTGVVHQLLRGLGRASANHPEVPLDRQVIEDALRRTLETCFRLIHWESVLQEGAEQEPRRRTQGQALLAGLVRDKRTHALERAFRILDLHLRGEDVKSIYRGLRSSKPKIRAGSRELLENLTQPPARGALLALVDDAPGANPLDAAGPYYEPRPVRYEELLSLLLEGAGETVSSVAAYHVGELGLTDMGARLESLREREVGFFVERVVDRALKLLARADGKEWAPAG